MLGVVIHYVGCNQPNAYVFAKSWKTKTKYGATHYVIDWNNGNIYRTIRENEIAFHVGSERGYTDLTKSLIGNHNPNDYFIGIECAIPSIENSKPSEIQWKCLVELVADILKRHNLTIDNLYLHFDITGKICHKWFVEHKEDWQLFKQDVDNKLNEEVKSMEKEIIPEWGKEAVEFVKSKKIMVGYENGEFGFNDALTRGQFAVVIKNIVDKIK